MDGGHAPVSNSIEYVLCITYVLSHNIILAFIVYKCFVFSKEKQQNVNIHLPKSLNTIKNIYLYILLKKMSNTFGTIINNYRGDTMIGCIYCIENTINHKKYIGQTIYPPTRWKTHKRYLKKNKHYNTHLQNSVNKYGLKNFHFYVIKYSKQKYLNRLEKLYIRLYHTNNNSYGYNKTIGGDGGRMTESIILRRTRDTNKIGVRYVSKFLDKRYRQGFRYRYANPNGQHLYSYDLLKLRDKVLKNNYQWVIVNQDTYQEALQENKYLRELYG